MYDRLYVIKIILIKILGNCSSMTFYNRKLLSLLVVIKISINRLESYNEKSEYTENVIAQK